MTSVLSPRDGATTVRAAVVQQNSQADVAYNLSRSVALLRQAKAEGAELAVLPENFAFMGEAERDKLAIVEDVPGDGPILSSLRKIAAELQMAVILGGFPERSPDPEAPYNTSLFLNERGEIVQRYRKIHLFDVTLLDGTTLRESAATRAGATDCVASRTADAAEASPDGGTNIAPVAWRVPVGMSICYDVRFPELFRMLTTAGAQIVTVPAAFTLTTGKDHWEVLLRARAIENQVYVLAPAQHGKHPRGRVTYGKSMIIDPWGDVIANVGEGEGVATATLRLDYLSRVRQSLPCLSHRRM
jgi:deaminated glutathione amidase